MIPNIYKGEYRYLVVIPLILILISLYFIPGLQLGVDFRGGTLITLQLTSSLDGDALSEDLLSNGFDAKVQVFETGVGSKAEVEVSQTGQMAEADELKAQFNELIGEVERLEAYTYTNASYTVEYGEKKEELYGIANRMFDLAGLNTRAELEPSLNELRKDFIDSYLVVYNAQVGRIMEVVDRHATYSAYSSETVSPALSTHFLEKAFWVVAASAVLSVIFVFFFFRTLVPSLAVLLGAFSDIVIALGAMSFFGLPLTLPSFAALLMLIGFSLDTDILLTMRIIKRKGDPRENAFDSMKTGMTMSITAIVAFSVLLILSNITHIATYYEIASVALAGLVGDLFATWGLNAVLVLWYKEKTSGGK